MYVLGLESSCDETAAAVICGQGEDVTLRADVIASQTDLHARYGGVVPELASRQHLSSITAVLDEVMAQAGLDIADINAVAVTRGPGLVGALLCAVQVGKAIAYSRGLPLCGVHHLAGHLLAPFVTQAGQAPVARAPFPYLGLLVSGGHSSIVRIAGYTDFTVLGQSRDDAAGEAFDKVGKLMGLPYPAGPVIDRLAQGGDPAAVALPRAMLGPRAGLDLSFSGLKTAVAQIVRERGVPTGQGLSDLCASFQAAVCEQLLRKLRLALDQHRDTTALVLSGGVACNSGLRAGLRALAEARGLPSYIPPPRLCTDNGAMIACAGYHQLRGGDRADMTLCASASLQLGRAA